MVGPCRSHNSCLVYLRSVYLHLGGGRNSFATFPEGVRSPCVPALSPRYLYMLKHVGVVADLPQLHDRVHQGFRTTFTLHKRDKKLEI